MDGSKTDLFNEMFGEQAVKEAVAEEQAYTRGFTHGLEAARIIAQKEGSVGLDELDELSEIALEMRVDRKGHPAFMDELLARHRAQGNGNDERDDPSCI